MRKFGVEEELLLVDAETLEPLPVAERVVNLARRSPLGDYEITRELKQEQIEVVSPPQTTLDGQLAAIRTGRALAEEAASKTGARVVSLPTAPGPLTSHLVSTPRFRQIQDSFGITTAEQLTCGFHVHVEIRSREEGVAVIDRIRGWLPVILALSANSPFLGGADTGFASYRYQLWNRWPTAGPTEIFGSAAAYDQLCETLLATRVPLDVGMLYFDARLSQRYPTVEVRVADVCLEAEHAAAIAALIRAMVETAAGEWREGIPPDQTPGTLIRTWSWQASHDGVDKDLIHPATRRRVPAADVLASLLDHVRPALVEYGEADAVSATLEAILRSGSGARRQREAYARRLDMHDVVAVAHDITHQ
ncbi:glutamate--cysteine ligase [Corynebacterium comes]|uniref:glutamate--cysteine ligase n=1 Tax=Corynebacterium comes TaxID=2675218 RepID=UPI0012E1C016|nr:glutamate--cysteine ligase [Corynebacterium comes]